jgi:heme peroxidase
VLTKAFAALCTAVDRLFGWDRLPPGLGIAVLIGLRSRLRARNLFDTGLVKQPPPPPRDVSTRTVDGSYNALELPAMGSVGTRFGRNIPLERSQTDPALLDPSPRLISRELLARTEFVPASTLNVLAAAWLQFEVHDWFSHETDKQAPPFELALADDDPWPERPMTVPRTQRDSAPDLGDDVPPVFPSYDSHWWDGSQIYGTGDEYARLVRAGEDGKLRLDDAGLPPSELEPYLDPPGIRGNFWLGLALLHGLFMREHNAICDHLRREYPTWTDDELYDRARLVNSAVMAKIHTVEWSPAVIAHPTTVRAMHANWHGLVGERFRRRFGRLGEGEVLSGIPGSPTDHHGVPFSLTEEFVAVYRMHPLMPDEYVLSSVGSQERTAHSFEEVGSLTWRERVGEVGAAGALASLGTAHPGAIVLHNFPLFLQQFRTAPGEPALDLAAVDVLRIRERGVPRYNEFRRLFHRSPVRSFEELTRDRAAAAELERIYGSVDRVDLMVGLYAEPRPKGFAFSDTAFRVFVLMASRRLKSDRFFTRDFTPEVYTRAGLEWIDRTTMVSVLLRHHPELAPVLGRVENAFTPWPPLGVERPRSIS